jgi:hypothetical protein
VSPYQEGYEAGLIASYAAESDRNPYPDGTTDHLQWDSGFQVGIAQERDTDGEL